MCTNYQCVRLRLFGFVSHWLIETRLPDRKNPVGISLKTLLASLCLSHFDLVAHPSVVCDKSWKSTWIVGIGPDEWNQNEANTGYTQKEIIRGKTTWHEENPWMILCRSMKGRYDGNNTMWLGSIVWEGDIYLGNKTLGTRSECGKGTTCIQGNDHIPIRTLVVPHGDLTWYERQPWHWVTAERNVSMQWYDQIHSPIHALLGGVKWTRQSFRCFWKIRAGPTFF